MNSDIEQPGRRPQHAGGGEIGDDRDGLPMTKEEIVEARRDLVRLGLVEYAGEFRGGSPVWRMSDFGRAIFELADAGDPEVVEFFDLARYTDAWDEILTRGTALSQRLGIPWRPVRRALA